MTSTPQPSTSSTTSPVIQRPGSAPPRTSTPTPPSRAIPTDFRSSLSAWWSTSSYKEARLAEERLLRRIASFEPVPAPAAVEHKGWFGSAKSTTPAIDGMDASQVGQIKEPIPVRGTGLVTTLRNVFIPTPNPADAPHHPADPREPGSAMSSTTDLSDSKSTKHCKRHKDKNGKLVDYINTLQVSTPENAGSKEAVVVLHGYAAALGFFFRNWESISQSSASTGRRTFFLDWLGMGLSSRPSPSLLASPSNTPIPNRVSRAEHFFLSSLESWRASVGLDKMVLVGHSLGGYLASAYAVRYPERVSGLILVSPAGVPHGPEYVRYPLTAELGSNESQVRQGEMTSPPETPAELEEATQAAEAEFSGGGKAHEPKGEAKNWQKDSSMLRKGMMKFFVWGWERGLSPFSILRGVGPFGPLWVGKYSARRFAGQTEEDVRDLHAYIYGTSVMKGSGEYCISHILAPGAYARIPIVDRITRVRVPVTFMYGDNDWMDVEGGQASVSALKASGNEHAACHVVPNAGHHLYLDNPEVTNRLLDEAIKAVPRVG